MPGSRKVDRMMIEVSEPEVARVKFHIVSTTPFLANAMTMRMKREILFPSPRKNAAAKAATLKHDPIREYRESVYTLPPGEPTLIGIPSTMPKSVVMTAALDMPGAAKSQIGSLVWVIGYRLPIWGLPMIHMSVVRNADINKTPDLRTRAIIPKWAMTVEFEFVSTLVTPVTLTNLLELGGRTSGLGDFRPEKGKGTFGQFRLCAEDDPEFRAIVQSGGREQQQKALEDPQPYDAETDELLEWYLK